MNYISSNTQVQTMNSNRTKTSENFELQKFMFELQNTGECQGKGYKVERSRKEETKNQ